MDNFDLYSTHLEPLKKIINIIKKPKVTIEFGMGNYSTELLLENSKKLISIEMQSEEWYNNMVKRFNNNESWEHHFLLGPYTFKNIQYSQCDLGFVDGHGDTRPECINMLMDLGCPVIVAHDTEEPGYGWDKVINPNYKRIDFKKHPNWTSLWTINDNLYKILNNE
jgi:hypothetical protein